MNFGIIAAGEGSRLAADGVSFHKPLVPLNGVPMIERLINIMVDAGARLICVIVNERMNDVARKLVEIGRKLPNGVMLELIIRSTPSSMHSFHALADHLATNERFILTTVDTIFKADDFKRFVKAWDEAPAGVDGMMALTPYVDDEKPLWVAVDRENENRITAFSDVNTEQTQFVSGGIYGLNSRCVETLGNCISSGVERMRNYQRALLEEGRDIRGLDMGKIIDVDHAADIAVAESFVN